VLPSRRVVERQASQSVPAGAVARPAGPSVPRSRSAEGRGRLGVGERRASRFVLRIRTDAAAQTPASLPPRPPLAFADARKATAASGDGRSGPVAALVGLGLGLLLGAAGALALVRRRLRSPSPRAPERDDVVEAALQEIIAEERAREISRAGAGLTS